jgi:hypothetical protein
MKSAASTSLGHDPRSFGIKAQLTLQRLDSKGVSSLAAPAVHSTFGTLRG